MIAELLRPERRGAKRHTFRNWRNRRKPCKEIIKPKRLFFHGQHEQQYSPRARTLSDDGGVGGVAQTWRPQPCRLGKNKCSHQLNDIRFSCQLAAVKTRVPYDHIAGSDAVSEDVYLTTELRKMAPKENIRVNLGQLMHVAYIFSI